MTVRNTIRDAQRRLAALDAAHSRAVAKLDQVEARRAEALAEQDRLLTAAKAELELAVADMADEIGAELTANVLGLDLADVRRFAKAAGLARSDNRGLR